MALLTRYMHLSSPEDCHVFNFVVTKSVTRDLTRDVVSREFAFASHRWSLALSRQEKTLGMSLVWKSPSDSLFVNLKMTVTLLNREYFGENRSFTLNKAKFSSDLTSHGNLSFIKLADLLTHRPRFTDHNGEFQVELKLSEVETYFEKEMLIQKQKSDQDHFDSLEAISNPFTYGHHFQWVLKLKPKPLLIPTNLASTQKSSWAAPIQKVLQQQRINSLGQDIDHLGLSAVLQRCPARPTNNKFANIEPLGNGLLARLSYKMTFIIPPNSSKREGNDAGQESNLGCLINKEKLSSEVRQELLAVGDTSATFGPRVRLQDLYSKRLSSGGLLSSGSGGYVKIRVTLESAFALSEFQLQPPNMVLDICKEEQRQLQSQESLEDASSFALKLIQDSKNNSVIRKCEKQLVGPIRQKSEKSLMLMTNNSANRVRGTDADNGNWQVDCDINSSFLRCCMVYQDVQKIPRNHLRFLQWRAFLVRKSRRWRGLRQDRAHLELVEFQAGHSFRCFYVQDDSDPGTVMETSVPSKDVREGLSEFVDQDGGGIKVRILWEHNYLLFQATFNQYDEVARFHNIQMRGEIASLTEKVRALEIAQVSQRKQQAIAMAALAAEKLKSQKKGSLEFQSDSNLHLIESNNQPQIKSSKTMANPINKRLLFKPHLSLDSGMNPEGSSNSGKLHVNPVNGEGAPKTAPTTPLGAAENLRKAHLNRTCTSSNLVNIRSQARLPQRSSSQKLIGDKRPHFAAGKRSASPQPRIITSTVSMVEAEHEAGSATQKMSTLPRASERPEVHHPSKPPLEKARSHSPINPLPSMEKSDDSTSPKTPPLPTAGLMRFLMPLKNSLSVSADNLPKPLSVTLAKNLGSRRPSKCQSFD